MRIFKKDWSDLSVSKGEILLIFISNPKVMCYYYTPEQEEEQKMMKRYRLKAFGNRPAPSFSKYYSNGFNHEYLPVITMADQETVQYFSWGLVPGFTKDIAQAKEIRNKTLNARSETVFTLPSFKYSIQSKRCLIPATGFFEWHTIGKDKYPYYIIVDGEQTDDLNCFSIGGIYNSWIDKSTGEVLNTFAIITTEGNEMMKFIHNSAKRMPFILTPEMESDWLSLDLNESQIQAIMKPYPASKMSAYSISKFITSRNQTPDNPQVKEPHNYESPDVPPVINIKMIESLA